MSSLELEIMDCILLGVVPAAYYTPAFKANGRTQELVENRCSVGHSCSNFHMIVC